MSQKILGIDLGTYSVKVVHLERQVQDLKILNFIEEELPQHSRHTHEEEVKLALDKIFANHILDADVVAASLPGQLLSARILDLPFTGNSKISQMMDFELEGHIPFAVEDIFSDFHVLSQEGNGSKVLSVYTQEAHVRKYLDMLASCGIDPKYFGADFTDLAAIAHVALIPKEGHYVICDIGHTKTNVLVMEGRNLRYVRTVGLGGYHFTRAVQRVFNLNYEKAEALKLSRGKVSIRDEDADQISRLLFKVAKELTSSIKQTLMGTWHTYGSIPISVIYCCGGGSKLVGLSDFLSFHLRANVFELDTLNFFSHSFDDTEELGKIIPQSLALVTRPIFAGRVPRVNFRKGPFAFKQDLQLIANEFKSVAAMMILVLVLGLTYYFYAGHQFQSKMQDIDEKVAKAFPDIKPTKTGKGKDKDKITPGKFLADALLKAKSKLADLEEMSAGGDSGANVVQVMYDISAALPPKSDVNFEVKEFNFADGFVRLNASTTDTLNVDKIVGALVEAQKFSSVEPTDAKPQPGGRWDFTIKMAVGEAPAEEE